MKTRIHLFSLAVVQVIFCLSVSAAPPKPTVTVPSTALKTYDLADFVVGNIPAVDTPFNPRRIMLDASFNVPGGKVIKMPGYPNHDVSGGALVWHVRFAPPAAGSYTATVTVTMPDGATSSDPFTFTVAQGTSKGFIHVAKNCPTMFEFDDGSPYIPIGNDLTSQGASWSSLSSRVATLGSSGGNWIRQWTSFYWSNGVFIEGAHPYQYNDAKGDQIDNLLKACQTSGVYAMLCLEHLRSIMGGCSAGSDPFCSPTFPYAKQNGGPCNTDADMFTNPEAQTMFKARERYFVARWGAYTSLFGWELWNEIGGMDAALDASISVPWHDTMAQYFHRVDPYVHPVSTEFSYAFSVKSMDVLNLHRYQQPGEIGQSMVTTLVNSEDAMSGYYNAISSYGKPFLFAESGIVDDNWGQSPYYKTDVTGYAFHEELWAPFMTASSGTGMDFWWGAITANYNKLFQAFSTCTRDIPLNKAPLTKANATISAANVQAFARTASWGTMAWFWDASANWESQVINGQTARSATGGTATIPVPAAGDYTLTIMNTMTGATMSSSTVTATGTTVSVPLPAFTIDVFVKLISKSFATVAVAGPRLVNKVGPSVAIIGRTIDVLAPNPGSLTIRMFDARGAKVFEARGSRACTIPASVPAGCYVMRLQWQSGAIERSVAVAR